MKVNPHGLTGASGASQSSAPQEAGRNWGADASKAGPTGEDRLELSRLAGGIARAEAAGAAMRASHVKEIAKLYRSGGYATDAGAISRKLVEEALADRVTGGENSES